MHADGETVLYTQSEMVKPSAAGKPSMCQYLQAIHPDEWENLLERLDVSASRVNELLRTADNHVIEEDQKYVVELRLWASLRGQTLARTVHGVMQYEHALLMLSQQEARAQNALLPASNPLIPTSGPVWTSEADWVRSAHLKFGYVVTCQVRICDTACTVWRVICKWNFVLALVIVALCACRSTGTGDRQRTKIRPRNGRSTS